MASAVKPSSRKTSRLWISTLENLHEVKVPAKITSKTTRRQSVPNEAPEFVRNVLGEIIGANGDNIPVSAFPVDGTFPTGTTQWEKRNIALEIPVWEADLCIQCGKCVMVCPHAVIRHKVYDEKLLASAPETFKHMPSKFKEFSQGYGLYRPGCTRGLHGLYLVRGSLPGEG